ncbi:MAG: GGDEF domain-containing protein [Pirellulales bacterium]|nr:GGDEF domain-containing protein [Pirellulales bacterium]
MNLSVRWDVSDLCDAQTALAAMAALPDGVFLLEPNAGTCRPLNAAAATMVDELEGDVSAPLPIEKCFPDFEHLTLLGLNGATHLAHFPSGKPGELCDVRVQFRRLNRGTDDGSDGANCRSIADAPRSSESILAIVRRIGAGLSADGVSPRDAFDDAFHDPLTRLPNRQLFARRLERAVRRNQGVNHRYAVLFIDLDRFKTANDRFGHLFGDRLLIAAAQRMVEVVRPQDMVARRDGDEFTILLDDLDSPQDAVHVAERIVERLNLPYFVDTADGPVEVTLGASIGVALPGHKPTTSEQLISQADAAMYHAKSLGGGTFVAPTGDGNKPKPR